MTETLLQRVKRHEGFKPKVYYDSVGVATIGHGITNITEAESERIVDGRLDSYAMRLVDRHEWLGMAHSDVLHVLTEMCFQLGWDGCHNFQMMWLALKAQDYRQAAHEMIDSKWHKQTKARCEELAGIIRGLA